MTKGGFAGRILIVDLTNKTIDKVPLDMVMAEHFGGGLGLCIKLAYDMLNPLCHALSPENTIVLGAGPLVGTSLPASSRVYGVTRFPGSSRFGWCGGGGMVFGCLLKNAGYDHIIIKGSSSTPVYLKIMDDDIEICDAAAVWGKGIGKTNEQLLDRHGRPAGLISIGQAGENRVSFSMAYIDRISTLGRGGFGAVMGSKNLKAIVVKGTKGIRVADASSYRILSRDILKKIRAYPYLKEWQDLGLLKSLPVVPHDVYRGLKIRRIACVSCPIGDKDLIKIGNAGSEQYICSSSAVNLFMPLVYGFRDPLEAARCIATLDDYGLDMFEFFGIMAFARVLQDQGIIPSEELFDMTSLSSMTAWADKVSRREGVGQVLAEGFSGIFSHFGIRAKDLAPDTAKGMLTYVGPKGPLPWNLFGTMELGQVMDPRGPHVGASGSPTYFARRSLDVFPQHLRRMGVPEEAIFRILPGLAASYKSQPVPPPDGGGMGDGAIPESEQALKIGRLLKYSHQWFTILGSLGICARAQINRFYDAVLCAELYEAVTGIKTDLDALRCRADRAWTLLHMANVRAGYSRKDDIVPEKWFQSPGFLEYLSDRPLSPDDVERMMDDYYDEQGWDSQTGIPTPERLNELGL
jgi:aldehyde:ferredoxin oxidoreductase